jgi:DNA-binding NtrC family response regulator
MERPQRILIIDDEEVMRDTLSDWLGKEGYRIETAITSEEALEKIEEKEYNIVIVDLKLPGMDGIQFLEELKKRKKEIPTVMITAYASIETAVLSMKKGAYDYLAKPFNLEELSLIVKKIVERQALIAENILLRKKLKEKYSYKNIIGRSIKMKRVFELVENVADINSTILIQGESGTGKEVIAQAIHERGTRRNGPFVSVNCAAIPENLLESELFGHEKGAFTGAINSKKGRFELADRGTLFLDEIAEMNLNIQVDLLRVLQSREFRRVGGAKLIKVDVRVIASTNRDLEKEVEKGNFRQDLYYRLNVIPVELPALRERKEDIPLLIEYFFNKYKKKTKRGTKGIAKEAQNILMDYDWPGNVRELENTMERAIVLGKGDYINIGDLPEKICKSVKEKIQVCYSLNRPLADIEREYILQALSSTNWNISKTAKLLKINRMTLYNKLKKYHIVRKRGKSA